MSQSLFIGSLACSTTQEGLSEHLSTVAPVASVTIPTDKISGRPRGFAFVEMESEQGAQKVIAELNERELDGRSLHISIAREQEQETEPCKLYVAGLADSVTNEVLTEHLSAAGWTFGK